MFSIKSLLNSFYTRLHFYLSNQFWGIIWFLNNKPHHYFINLASPNSLAFIIFTLVAGAMLKLLAILFVFFDFNFLDFNFFKVIYCESEDLNGNQILERTNRPSSSVGIENGGQNFVANSSRPANPDRTWAMTTIRPGYPEYSWEMTSIRSTSTTAVDSVPTFTDGGNSTIRPNSPNAIENFGSVETFPDGVNTNLRSRAILKTVLFGIGGFVVAGVVIAFGVLAATHSL